MKKILVLIVVVFIGFSNVNGQEVDKKYIKTLNKMFKVSGTEESYKAVTTQYLDMFKNNFPDVDVDFWKELENGVLKVSIEELTELIAPIYVKYLSLDDLKELIKFYQSDIGKKLTKVTPLITVESMKIGEEWGRKLGEDIAKKLENLKKDE